MKNKVNKINNPKDYFDRVHKWGIMWNITALLLLLSIPIAVSVDLGVWPKGSDMLKIMPPLMLSFWLFAVVEVFAYVPMLGAGGAYLSFVTGNITNLKLPCGIKAMEDAKVKSNTEEGEVISTIAIGVSAITTTVILAVGVLLLWPVLPKITDGVLKPAFDYVLPALFGALAAGYLAKHWKLFILPLIVGVIVLIILPTLPAGTLLVPTIIVAIGGTLLLSKLNLL